MKGNVMEQFRVGDKVIYHDQLYDVVFGNHMRRIGYRDIEFIEISLGDDDIIHVSPNAVTRVKGYSGLSTDG